MKENGWQDRTANLKALKLSTKMYVLRNVSIIFYCYTDMKHFDRCTNGIQLYDGTTLRHSELKSEALRRESASYKFNTKFSSNQKRRNKQN